MNKTVQQCVLIVSIGLWIFLSISAPWVLDDNNGFLKNFVDQQFLGFLGVVVTIILASTASLHLELNKIEEQAKRRIFNGTRNAIRKSAFWLIGMLFVSLVLVVSKPLICSSNTARSFVNGAALLIVLFNILVLIDITQTIFKLEPQIDDE